MSAYDWRPRRIPSLSERERPDSPLEDGLETDRQFLENDSLNTKSIVGTDFHDKVLAVVEPRKKIDRDRPPGHRTRETLRIPENLALAGYLLSFVNYSSSVIFFSPPPGVSQNSRNSSHFRTRVPCSGGRSISKQQSLQPIFR